MSKHDDGWLEFSRAGQAGQQVPRTDQPGPGPYSGQECACAPFSWVYRQLPKRDGLVGWTVILVMLGVLEVVLVVGLRAKTGPDSLHVVDRRDLQTRCCWRYLAQMESSAFLPAQKRSSVSVSRARQVGLVGEERWGMVGIHPSSKQTHLTFFCSSSSSCSACLSSLSLQPLGSTIRSNNSLYCKPKASKA